ncbi:MAG TPA: phosphoribosyltransferase family protein [Planctomycetota bacterium]|nr:phosphoribosyltransferase family protein [Planctomycetota bacterium]
MIRPAFPVVITRDDILCRVHELARAIAADHPSAPPRFVAVMEGARVFAEHLCALVPGSPPFTEVRARSYGNGTVSNGRVRVEVPRDLRLDGAPVVLVEDIVDTGRTVEVLTAELKARGAHSVEVATLLSKPARRVVDVPLRYVGFEIPDEFVIGFGMDVAGRYRELPYVAAYRRELEPGAADAGAVE